MKLDVGAATGGIPNSLAGRIERLRERIADAAREAGRLPSEITLVAVTKRQPRDTVIAAIDAGLSDVGENYAQEAHDKYAGLHVRKHFIGHVQTNKAKAIVAGFDVVQSVDRLEAGRAIAKAARQLGKPVRTLLQVNISPEDRYGVAPEDAAELATRLRDDEGLEVDGIMAIGPNTGDRAALAAAFALAARTLRAVGGEVLSIGMSGDWREAIGSGSTMLRIGTAIFGAR